MSGIIKRMVRRYAARFVPDEEWIRRNAQLLVRTGKLTQRQAELSVWVMLGRQEELRRAKISSPRKPKPVRTEHRNSASSRESECSLFNLDPGE